MAPSPRRVRLRAAYVVWSPAFRRMFEVPPLGGLTFKDYQPAA